MDNSKKTTTVWLLDSFLCAHKRFKVEFETASYFHGDQKKGVLCEMLHYEEKTADLLCALK